LKEIGLKGFWFGEFGLTAEMKITEELRVPKEKGAMLVNSRAESKDVQKSKVP
jgi:hypothetical protein